MSNEVSPNTVSLLEGIVTRVMREDGFIGYTEVVSARKVKDGYSVLVKATVGGHSERYRALVPFRSGKVKVRKVERKS